MSDGSAARGAERCELAIVGAGIVGLATARAALRAGRRGVVVVEAENGIARHQTGHNSGVVHSGLYYAPGSSKARHCVRGRQLLEELCRDRGIPYRRTGKLVVALDASELSRLATLEERGRANGLDGVERLSPAEMRQREPEVAGIAGLWVPQTGVVDYRLVAAALRDEVERLRGEVRTGWRLAAAAADGDRLLLSAAGRGSGSLSCRQLVNCAGLQSDRVARLCGARDEVRIIPFRGEYYRLRGERAALVRGLIYPVPDPAYPFLGVHFTRGIDDVVEAGPNAVLALSRSGYGRFALSPRDLLATAAFPGSWRLAARVWRMAVDEVGRSLSRRRFAAALRRLVPAVAETDLEWAGCGIRAQAVDRRGRLLDDFHIVERPGAIHVLNAPSPGATASLAIGETLAGLLARRQAA